MNDEQIQDAINLQIFARRPFTLTLTNYTAYLESDFFPSKVIESGRSIKFFIAAKMVERDCKKKPLPDVSRDKVFYNDFKISKEIFLEEIAGVDISSAYATVLFLDGYISKKTFNYISSLSKLDRLGAIGSMAARKNVFKYDKKGRLYSFEEKIKETENYFYYCVKRTYDIMSQVREIVAESYLFTWVDCIYFSDTSKIPDVIEALKKLGLKSKPKKYTQFLIKARKKNGFKCTFVESTENGDEEKVFFVPDKGQKIRDSITKYILKK